MCVDEYMATVHDWLKATLWEAQAQSVAEAQWWKHYYDQKIGAMDLKPGDLVLVKADVFNGKRKIKVGRWGMCGGASDCDTHPLLQSDGPM